MSDKSKQQLWRESLDGKHKKVKIKDLRAALEGRILSSEDISDTKGKGKGKAKGQVTDWRVVGLNFNDSQIVVENSSEEACLKDFATLNGITVE